MLAEKKQYIADNPVKAATYDIAAYKAKYPKATKVKGFDTIKNKFQTSETKVASTTLSKVNNKSIVSSGITVVKMVLSIAILQISEIWISGIFYLVT